MIAKTVSLSTNDKIRKTSKEIGEKFKKLNNLYNVLHIKVARGYAVLPDGIYEIEESIENYMAFYRQMFPDKVIPKQHFLEEHVPQWMRQWNFGLALHCKQGGEGVHKEFNRLGRVMQGVRNGFEKLHVIMKEHHTAVSPVVQRHIVIPQKRPKSYNVNNF